MSFDIRRAVDADTLSVPATLDAHHDGAVFSLHYDDDSIALRWPQLARGYGENDFTSVRATVFADVDTVDHPDLHTEPEDCLRLCEDA
ncbi:hypothetical protein [Haloarchaeobius sp. DFWS5]|uniref:hypothetical protein n=1 Tax=Haloarchaeobius sp. DFWS5 TaxID=3446114 RepID=UPI003EB99859